MGSVGIPRSSLVTLRWPGKIASRPAVRPSAKRTPMRGKPLTRIHPSAAEHPKARSLVTEMRVRQDKHVDREPVRIDTSCSSSTTTLSPRCTISRTGTIAGRVPSDGRSHAGGDHCRALSGGGGGSGSKNDMAAAVWSPRRRRQCQRRSKIDPVAPGGFPVIGVSFQPVTTGRTFCGATLPRSAGASPVAGCAASSDTCLARVELSLGGGRRDPIAAARGTGARHADPRSSLAPTLRSRRCGDLRMARCLTGGAHRWRRSYLPS